MTRDVARCGGGRASKRTSERGRPTARPRRGRAGDHKSQGSQIHSNQLQNPLVCSLNRTSAQLVTRILSLLQQTQPRLLRSSRAATRMSKVHSCFFSGQDYLHAPSRPPVAAFQAPLINSTTPSTPSPNLTLVKSVGPLSRILSASVG